MSTHDRTHWLKRASLAVVAVYWAAVFAATHVPRLRPMPLVRSDKLLHASAYGVLAFLLAWAWSLHAPFGRRAVLATLTVLAVYGAFDEITQSLVGRTPDLADWIADMAGSTIGLGIFLAASRLLRRTT